MDNIDMDLFKEKQPNSELVNDMLPEHNDISNDSSTKSSVVIKSSTTRRRPTQVS